MIFFIENFDREEFYASANTMIEALEAYGRPVSFISFITNNALVLEGGDTLYLPAEGTSDIFCVASSKNEAKKAMNVDNVIEDALCKVLVFS